MNSTDTSSRIDFGRLAAVAVFSFLMVINFLCVKGEIKTLFPIDRAKALELAHNLLVAGFYVLVIALYFLRGQASATTGSFPAKFIAVFASFVPFFIPLLGSTSGTGAVMLSVSNLFMLAGTLFALAALGTLGKSFSIIAQTRKLVVRGPYRLVRHPVYLGEITAMLGLTLAGVSIFKILIFLLLAGCQVYRSIEEEKLLSASFPKYADYASKTARFLPGLF